MKQHTCLKTILLFTFPFLASLSASAQGPYPYDTRSDSISITQYTIDLDLRDFTTFVVKGHTEAEFEPLVDGIMEIKLDLIGPAVDSVKDDSGNLLTFFPAPLGFIVNLGATFNTGDATSIHVYYHGTTVQDPTFGGFYFNSSYAYNVGVSLDDIPHNYGKTWFPCFDNFTTRSLYELYVTTLPQHEAACGGVHLGTVVNPDLSETHHWKINQTIPSYLASVAVAGYTFVNDTYTNYLGDPVPVSLAAPPASVAALNGSFINLEEAFDIYEDRFGPYRWDRIGYVLVPMTSGAMEHAMNIAYPLACANGNLTYQSIMAHELSHHWWGDLVTCRTAEDMWINEGSAAYCEFVFTEGLSGRAAYESAVRSQHKELLRTCHFDDDGYWPLSGMPQEHTYGATTYSKGADVIHTMRGYLGDTLFFNGLTQLLEDNQFSDIDAMEYRDDLSAITGYDLTDFFDAWIFQGGWPHASIDSLTWIPNGMNYDVTVHLKQKLVGRTNYAQQMPLTLTLRDNDWNTFEQTIHSSGMTNTVTVTVPFQPTLGYLNRDELISHAVTATYSTIDGTGNITLAHSNLTLQVQTSTDSTWFVAEHNWAAPDPVIDWSEGYLISPERYWRIDGIWNPGFSTNATFRYCGAYTGANGYLDDLLITGAEDSIVLLYRPDRSTDWELFPTQTLNIGNPNDRSGTIAATNIQKGEYAIALRGQPLAVEESTAPGTVILYPNPTDGWVTVETKVTTDRIAVTDTNGKIVSQQVLSGNTTGFETKGWPKGPYWVNGFEQEKLVFRKALIVK